MARHDAGNALNFALEAIRERAVVHAEAHLRERDDAQFQRLARQHGAIAVDESLAFETPETARARRFAQADALGQFRDGHAAVVLERSKHRAIDAVDFGHGAIPFKLF
ncbi:hypothetical protein BG60_36830 [Caballeronia zhejiangensis]|uniref:Uncharacterized protein n=1 Tax=Caballeronia zhejiangensis TaxID=871203 RepID=A0A656QNW6_9BURK|nr:hypothetical protein BG60_36830 [Caballeronia zhejiangensis]